VTVEPRAVYSQLALDDLEELEVFIANRDGQLRAEAALAHIKARIRNLAFMPRMGTPKPHLRPSMRSFPAPPWSIVYEIIAGGIRILPIVDGRRDLRALFSSPK
jgi:plasmid stabilization system protein ParE